MKSLIMALVPLVISANAHAGRFTCTRGDEWSVELDTTKQRVAFFDNDSWAFGRFASNAGETLPPTHVYRSDKKSDPWTITFQGNVSNPDVKSLRLIFSDGEPDTFVCVRETQAFGNGKF